MGSSAVREDNSLGCPQAKTKRPPHVFILSNTYPYTTQYLLKQGKLKSGGLDDNLDDEDQHSAVLLMVLFASVPSALPSLTLHSLIFQPVTGMCCVSMSQMCLFVLFWLLLVKEILHNAKHGFLIKCVFHIFQHERFNRNEKQIFHST